MPLPSSASSSTWNAARGPALAEAGAQLTMSMVELTVPVNFLRLSKRLFEINLDFPTGPAQHCPLDPEAKETYFGTFEDPECPVVHSAGSGLFVAVYCITACAVIFTLLHAIHRRHRFRREARALGVGDAEAGSREGALRVAFGEDMQAQGFHSSRLGTVALVALEIPEHASVGLAPPGSF